MGTRRAWKPKSQMSQAQFRAKIEALAMVGGRSLEAEIESAPSAGRTHDTASAGEYQICVWLAFRAGITGLGCESDGSLAEQQDIFTPCWQQAGTDCPAHLGAGVRASRNGVPASTKLQMMASASFMRWICSKF